jgi:ATP-dependent helicase/DNAse subunit B
MLRGDIAIQPYMKGTKTPCPQCEFRNVCRIERGHVKYDVLEPIDRSTVLTQLTTIPEP